MADEHPDVELREVSEDDLATFFQHQLDREANRLAGLRPRPRDEFEAHWARLMDDPEVVTRSVIVDGRLAGHLVSFIRDRKREVGYWIGKAFSGRGVATKAMQLFLDELPDRPLHARVISANLGSIRVLVKLGFALYERVPASPGDPVEELRFVLTEPASA